MIRKNRTIILTVLLLAIVCVTASAVVTRCKDEKATMAGKQVKTAIAIKKDFKDGARLLAGLNYHMLKDLAAEKQLADSIFAIRGNEYDWADSLRSGALDIAVLAWNDSIEDLEGITYSRPIDSLCVWAVGANLSAHIDEINEWIESSLSREEFGFTKDLYCETINPRKAAARGIKSDHIGPYDEIFKEYSDTIGWDWRLLAAMSYEESRFSILSHSPVGACGLMQVMPSTARRYEVDNLLDPEENIAAGTMLLSALQKRYRSGNFSHSDRIRFTLAAYNAGSGRMHSYLEAADSQSLNKYKWDDVEGFINPATKAYVDSVMSTYAAICSIVEK